MELFVYLYLYSFVFSFCRVRFIVCSWSLMYMSVLASVRAFPGSPGFNGAVPKRPAVISGRLPASGSFPQSRTNCETLTAKTAKIAAGCCRCVDCKFPNALLTGMSQYVWCPLASLFEFLLANLLCRVTCNPRTPVPPCRFLPGHRSCKYPEVALAAS